MPVGYKSFIAGTVTIVIPKSLNPMGHGITPDAPEDKTERAQLHNVTKSVRLVSRAVVEGDLPGYESMELHARLYEYKISKNTIIALVYAHRLADPPGDHSAITCV